MKTFIHHDGALGDVLLSLPCIGAIRDEHGAVHLAGRPDVAGLLKDAGLVHEAYSTDSGLYASLYTDTIDPMAAEFLRQYDRAYVFTARDDSAVAASISRLIPRTDVVLTIPPHGINVHVSGFRLKQLKIRSAAAGRFTSLSIPAIHAERARKFLTNAGHADGGGPLVALHPGSGGKRKCWPLERYLDLAGRLMRDPGAFIVIFSGPAEDYSLKEALEDFAKSRKGVIHLRDEGLAAAAAVLGMCDLYVGNDSGITHLAAAAGADVIALFGPTDPAIWGPGGRSVHVVSKGPSGGCLDDIIVDEVYAIADEILGRPARTLEIQRG